MYSIIVADDQKMICDGLERLIKQEFPDLNLIGSYNCGRDLMPVLKKHIPDIIITDIIMPDISGLDICKYIRQFSSSTQIILISGYKEFEYAQKAIEYNVLQYLVKPYSTRKLVDAVRSAVSNLSSINIFSRISNDTYKSFLSDIYYGYVSTESAIEIKLLNNTVPANLCLVSEYEIKCPQEYSDRNFSFEELNTEKITSLHIDNMIIVFYKDANEDKNYISGIRASSESNCSIDKKFSLPFDRWCEYCKTRNAAHALAEACKAMKINEFVSSFKDVVNSIEDTSLFFKLAAEKLNERRMHDFTAAPGESISDAANRFFDTYISLKKDIPSRISQYIEKNYADPNLCTSQIASHFNLSNNYVSEIFKRQSGMSISDCINNLRIDKACKLFNDNRNISIDSVAAAVGYNSQTYFGKIFKAKMHITPSQYKRNNDSLKQY